MVNALSMRRGNSKMRVRLPFLERPQMDDQRERWDAYRQDPKRHRLPDPDVIDRRAKRIRLGWSTVERQERRAYPNLKTPLPVPTAISA